MFLIPFEQIFFRLFSRPVFLLIFFGVVIIKLKKNQRAHGYCQRTALLQYFQGLLSADKFLQISHRQDHNYDANKFGFQVVESFHA